jgi:hypothetical protein
MSMIAKMEQFFHAITGNTHDVVGAEAAYEPLYVYVQLQKGGRQLVAAPCLHEGVVFFG